MNWVLNIGFLGVIAVAPIFGLLASGDSGIPIIAQYGLLGPLAGAVWWAYRREANRADRLETELLKALPALTQATTAVNESNVLMREIGDLLRVPPRRGATK